MHVLQSATKICLLAIVFAVIAFTGLGIDISEPMKSITLLIVGAYFGKQSAKNTKNDQE